MSPLRVHSPTEADRKQTFFTSHYVTTELHVQDDRKGFASALASGDLSCRHMTQVQDLYCSLNWAYHDGMMRGVQQVFTMNNTRHILHDRR